MVTEELPLYYHTKKLNQTGETEKSSAMSPLTIMGLQKLLRSTVFGFMFAHSIFCDFMILHIFNMYIKVSIFLRFNIIIQQNDKENLI